MQLLSTLMRINTCIQLCQECQTEITTLNWMEPRRTYKWIQSFILSDQTIIMMIFKSDSWGIHFLLYYSCTAAAHWYIALYTLYNYALFHVHIIWPRQRRHSEWAKLYWICMCNKYEIWCLLKMQSKILYQINFTNINVPFLLINIWFLLYLLQSVTILWRRSLWLLSVYSVITLGGLFRQLRCFVSFAAEVETWKMWPSLANGLRWTNRFK